jgi:hypothetical protein
MSWDLSIDKVYKSMETIRDERISAINFTSEKTIK